MFRSLADVANFINSSFLLPTISTELVLAKRFCPREAERLLKENAKREEEVLELLLNLADNKLRRLQKRDHTGKLTGV